MNMNKPVTYDFEVLKVVWHHNRGNFIFAKHLGNSHDFDIPDGAVLGDVPVYSYEPLRGVKDKNGVSRPEMFVFQPISLKWLADNHFTEGQQVKLIIV